MLINDPSRTLISLYAHLFASRKVPSVTSAICAPVVVLSSEGSLSVMVRYICVVWFERLLCRRCELIYRS